MTFDIRAIVRAIIADTDIASPHDIAIKAAEAVPDVHLRAALADALVDLANKEVTRARMAPTTKASGRPKATGRSSKVASIRAAAEAWREVLHTRVRGVHEWKLLADFCRSDVRYAKNMRHEMSRRNAARATWYAILDDLMEAHGVDRVGDLPDDVLRAHVEASTEDDEDDA